MKQKISVQPDRTVCVWNTDSGTCLTKLLGHHSWVMCLAALPQGLLASGSDDRTIRLWDVSSGTCLLCACGMFAVAPTCSRLRATATRLRVWLCSAMASGSYDRTVRVWDPTDGTCLLRVEHTNLVKSVAALPNGELASSCHGGVAMSTFSNVQSVTYSISVWD